ncbi:MAG TPA: NAD(P)-binding domain-containing protein [Thermoleophilaceae bacterium]|jgi:8-hydroxy-5-deazaflavin:NADPH oxidoreductase|nr:NAD(P)-binding domain-containing protein [Thermoleophilaceae bacterium]
MRIGIVGAGRIGGNAGRLFARAGHDVMFSFSRQPQKLQALADETGGRAGTPAEAAAFGDLVMLSAPWTLVDEALAQAGSLEAKIVIDTTNQFGRSGLEDLGELTAAQLNAGRMPGARYVKSFNTLTSGFQAEASQRSGDERVVLFLCGDDAEAKAIVAGLIEDAGFVPADVGGTADAGVMEAPRREGAVYGEEYREPEARAVVEALQAGEPIPPTPAY